MRLSVIIPAYNEAAGVQQTAETLCPVIGQLRQHYDVEVIFIDDGSQDDTLQRLQQTFGQDAGIQIIPHGVNRGLGAALRTGFTHATGDLVVTTDFDGTYKFDTIPALIARLEHEQVDLVTASPYHPAGGVEGVPHWRLFVSQGASLLYRLLVNWHIHTWTALFRVYRQPVIKTIPFENDGFLAGTELLVKALQRGYTVAEFPTILHTRSFGQSSIKVARVTLTHLKYLWRILVEKITRQTERS